MLLMASGLSVWPSAWRLLSPWDLSSLWLLCFLLDGHYALHTLLMPNANSIASHCPRQRYQHSFSLPSADRLCEHTDTLLSKVRLVIRTDSNIVSSRRNHITMLIPFTAREKIPEPRLYYSRRAEPCQCSSTGNAFSSPLLIIHIHYYYYFAGPPPASSGCTGGVHLDSAITGERTHTYNTLLHYHGMCYATSVRPSAQPRSTGPTAGVSWLLLCAVREL